MTGRSKEGFTVIELAIAVMIVAILSAIAIPSYRSYAQRNLEAIAISDIKTIEWKLKAILAENPTALPADLAAIDTGHVLPLVDPWGNPYRYVPFSGHPENLASARKDHNLHPINSDFDLYSMGSDGKTALALTAGHSRDDILRANDGVFIGRASTYDP